MAGVDNEALQRSRFQPGNPGGPGRPKGNRNKLAEVFLKAMLDDFNAHGVDAIAAARAADPAAYLRVLASILPKEIAGENGEPLVVKIVRFNGVTAPE